MKSMLSSYCEQFFACVASLDTFAPKKSHVEALDFRLTAQVVGSLVDQSFPSGHAPISMSIHPKRTRTMRNATNPDCITKLSFFASDLNRLHKGHEYTDNPMEPLEDFKPIAMKAHSETRRALMNQTPTWNDATFLLSRCAFRAQRLRQHHRC